MSALDDLLREIPCPDYDVTCARCGKVLSVRDAYVEEGNEWECPPCWERCEAQEKATASEAGAVAGGRMAASSRESGT